MHKWIWALVAGILIGLALNERQSASVPTPVTVRQNIPEYRFINPVLFTEVSKVQYPDLNPLRNKMNDYIRASISKNDALDVSVYFRDLTTSHWTGVNEDEIYSPGSMLKVAALLTYLRAAERDSHVLQERLSYVAQDDPGQYFKPEHQLPSGLYPVEALINSMIVDSDNVATETLIDHDLNDYLDIYKIFQLPLPPEDPTVTDFMSPHQYSTLFRALYNATYLSSSVSDQALQLLTLATFKEGLAAGLPVGTVVAHKFGEHRNTVNGAVTEVELHDCGIIYAPNKPYFLCVMTKGRDFPHLETVISGMSKLVYEYVMGK